MKQVTSGGWILAAGLAALAALAAGCGTMAGDRMSACKDPDIGYWMAATAGNAKLQAVYASRVASAEFARRKKREMPATLHDLRAYRKSLLVPVEVATLLSPDSPDLRGLPAAQIEKMDGYVAAHKDAGFISGAQCLKEWADEVARIQPAMAALEETVDRMVRGAAAKLKQGDLAGAEAGWRDARKLDTDGANILQMEKQIIVAKNRAKLDELTAELKKTVLAKAAEAQKVFGTPESSEVAVKNCLSLLSAADKAVAQFRDGLKTSQGEKVTSDEIDKALVETERDIAAGKAVCWAEQIRLLGAGKQPWAAYQYAHERMKEAADAAEHRKAAMAGRVQDAYGRILPGALGELVAQANTHFARDAHGISLTLCRMAEEMLHFARDRQIRIPPETLTWEKRCAESRMDAQKKIAAALQRRVLIGEFTPATRENQLLFSRVLDRCSARMSDSAVRTARAAWGVTVEKAAEKARPSDYVIECNVQDFFVGSQAPVEMERSVLKIGRDVREIPNPAYNPETNKNAPKTVFSQEVYLYQKIRTKHSRKARLQAGVACIHDSRRKSILSLDTDFGDEGTKLEGVRMSSIEEMLDVPFVGPPRISASRAELVADPWPRAVPPAVSSEAEIAGAIQKYAVEKIADTITGVASSYPVDVLASEAERSGKLGNKYDSANYWGQCLEYCSQLVPDGGKGETSWVSQKERMLGRIADLCGTYWKDCNGEVLRKMPDLWSEAVRSALEAPLSAQ